MKFHIKHEISWQYDRPVFIEPMTIRLRPQCDGSLNLLNWQLTLNPQPVATSHSLDALGNTVSVAWFSEKHERLNLTALSTVETIRANPFDYLLPSGQSEQLPLRYDEAAQNCLMPYCCRSTVADDRVGEWANRLAAANTSVQAFLSALVGAMFEDFEMTIREDGPAMAPEETFETRRGACRDIAVVFIDACRSMGIASRFASGYAFEPDREGFNELHAWAEVYLPGVGWRGYDPTMGLAVADRHVLLASAPEPDGAAPTTGSYRGTGVESTIEHSVKVQELGQQ